MIAFFIFVLSGLGSLMLALGMNRHHGSVFGHAPGRRNKCRAQLTGTILLLTSLSLAVADQGAGVGFIQWMIALGLSAMAVGFALPLLKAGR